MKITFMGAGSTNYARNVIGDCMCSETLKDSTFALYDIVNTKKTENREYRSPRKGVSAYKPKKIGNFSLIDFPIFLHK